MTRDEIESECIKNHENDVLLDSSRRRYMPLKYIVLFAEHIAALELADKCAQVKAYSDDLGVERYQHEVTKQERDKYRKALLVLENLHYTDEKTLSIINEALK